MAGKKTFLKHTEAIPPDKENTYLSLIVVFGVLLSLLLLKGPSIYGDDTSYLQYIPAILDGSFRESINIFSIRLLEDVPLAISVAFLGYTDLAAGIWSLISYAVAIVATHKIGKELYGVRAGLISSLFFSIYPLAIHYNTTPEPMLPLAMFGSLSVLFFIYGTKKGSPKDYALSGVFGFLGVLTNPLAYLYLAFYAFYIIASSMFSLLNDRPLDHRPFWVFVGLLTAVAAMGYINIFLASGKPFAEFALTNSYYSAAGGPDQIYYTNPSLTFYPSNFFPYNFTGKVIGPLLRLNPAGAASGLVGIADSLFSSKSAILNEVGLFGYFVLISGAYLLWKEEKRAGFALLLAAFLIAYMEFGSMSITRYFPIYKLMRFTAVVAVPFMLVLGIGCTSFISSGRKRHNEVSSRELGVAALFLLLFSSSLAMNYFYYAYNHNTMLFVKEMAKALGQAQLSGANVFTPALTFTYLGYYLGYPKNVTVNQYDNGAYGGLFLPTCASIPNNTYLIIPNRSGLSAINNLGLWTVNETWAFDPSICSLRQYANIYNNTELRNLGSYDIIYTGSIYYKK